MESVNIWTVVAGIVSVVQLVGTIVVFCIIKFNDVAHLDKKLDTIEGKQDALTSQISSVSKDVSFLMGVNKGKELKTKRK